MVMQAQPRPDTSHTAQQCAAQTPSIHHPTTHTCSTTPSHTHTWIQLVSWPGPLLVLGLGWKSMGPLSANLTAMKACTSLVRAGLPPRCATVRCLATCLSM